MNQRFIDLVPGHVSGTLSANDQAWMEAHLKANPQDEREVQRWRSIGDAARGLADDVPAATGLEAVMSRIDAADRLRFNDLVPSYVNGTLAAEEQAWMDAHLKAHPRDESGVRRWRSIGSAARDLADDAPATTGLEALMSRIEAAEKIDAAGRVEIEQGIKAAARIKVAQRPRFLDWLSAFLAGGRQGSALLLRPSVAVIALAIMSAQGGAIVTLLHDQSRIEVIRDVIRIQGAEVIDDPLLRLNLASETKEKDLRFLLLREQATLVGGPGQLGDYYLRVPRGQEEAAVKRLRSSPWVEKVEKVPGIPTKDQ